MKKDFLSINSKFLVGLLCVIMVLSTAVSFAFWKANITGNHKDKGLNINIGRGEAIETEVDLSSVVLDGKSLVPTGRANDSTKTDKIEFTVNVLWQSQEILFGTDKDNFETHEAQLTVTCTSILLDGTIEAKNLIGLGGGTLFKVEIEQAFYPIFGNDTTPVAVKIKITMTEPKDKEQYDLVAGRGITVFLKFEVESQFDLA